MEFFATATRTVVTFLLASRIPTFMTTKFAFNFSQVVAGLLVPIYIKKLDFKTRDELQQMPQTEEEHLENQYLDYEDKEKSITDAEVRDFDGTLMPLKCLQYPIMKVSFSKR